MLLEKLVTYCRDLLNGRKTRKKAFLENGSMALEKLVATCNGRPILIRNFSIEEIALATNNYDPGRALHTGCASWYMGSLEGREISVKKSATRDEALTDMTISEKMRAHNNVLKLIGCCLETPVPLLVFESTPNETLLDRIYAYDFGETPRQRQPIEWRSKLNIAREIAHAIAYLHHAFSKPIIHRDICPGNIFLDQHDIPKLFDFSLSIPIPENETQVPAGLDGTFGYTCPRHLATGWITEIADVCSFGVLLLELLSGLRSSELRVKVMVEDDLLAEGASFEQQLQAERELVKDYIRKHDIDEIVDPEILAEAEGACVKRQLQAVLDLAVTCMEHNPELRPTMVDVSKKLRWIGRSVS